MKPVSGSSSAAESSPNLQGNQKTEGQQPSHRNRETERNPEYRNGDPGQRMQQNSVLEEKKKAVPPTDSSSGKKSGLRRFIAAAAAIVLVIAAIFGQGTLFNDDSKDVASVQPSAFNDDSEGELTFRTEILLESHYEKHGIDMGFESAEAYQDAAAAVVSNPNALHKQEQEDQDDVYYLESSNEFVIVSTDGYLRTYFCPDDGIDYYNKQ
ncbi:MAG: hypothetical protein PUB22_04740 [Clostridiales bacterium]|nr:hypothetical protein [Clostridiales bacterium]